MRAKVVGAGDAAAALRGAAVEVRRAQLAVTRKQGALLQTRVRANASGRSGVTYSPLDGEPGGEIGPRAQTGDYRRSIRLTIGATDDGTPYAEVSTNAPQGARLEFGFFGTDSLGRSYKQPALPHFRPALDQTAPEYAAALQQAVLDVLAVGLKKVS